MINEIKWYATVAAQQSLNKEMIEGANILVPNINSINKMNELLNRMINLEYKIRYLKEIKNNLLNKYF